MDNKIMFKIMKIFVRQIRSGSKEEKKNSTNLTKDHTSTVLFKIERPNR